jgi:hypothetical protein
MFLQTFCTRPHSVTTQSTIDIFTGMRRSNLVQLYIYQLIKKKRLVEDGRCLGQARDTYEILGRNLKGLLGRTRHSWAHDGCGL